MFRLFTKIFAQQPHLRSTPATGDTPLLARLTHHSGYVRAAALDRLNGPINDPETIRAVLLRLNDWVPQVRTAAMAALLRCVATTSAEVWAPILKTLLPQMGSWKRWGKGAHPTPRDVAFDLLLRQDVLDVLLVDLLHSREGKLGLVFALLNRNVLLDAHLQEIAAQAALPHIRGMALTCLLTGEMRWPTGGTQMVWVDKSLGKRRLERVYKTRPLSVDVPLLLVLETATSDKARGVRLNAADGLIAHRQNPEVIPRIPAMMARLSNDPSPAMQGRMEFLGRKLVEEG